jgi:hypothetical protein
MQTKQAKTILSHELQLKQQLNQSVKEQRRADFALMLAMLDDDVCQHSQFHLPHQTLPSKAVDTALLRKQFQVPEPAPLAPDSSKPLTRYSQAKYITPNLATIRLNHALKPQPVAAKDDVKYIDEQIIANCALTVRQRLTQSQPKPFESTAEFDAMNWLNAVAEMRVYQQKQQVAA